jgi:hypothetical protein
LDFATVLEGYSGSFEPPQNYIVRVCHASYILISTQHIATVFPTDTQNATDNFVSIKTVRKKKKIDLQILNPIAAILNRQYSLLYLNFYFVLPIVLKPQQTTNR